MRFLPALACLSEEVGAVRICVSTFDIVKLFVQIPLSVSALLLAMMIPLRGPVLYSMCVWIAIL